MFQLALAQRLTLRLTVPDAGGVSSIALVAQQFTLGVVLRSKDAQGSCLGTANQQWTGSWISAKTVNCGPRRR